jgi:hypothetical protein
MIKIAGEGLYGLLVLCYLGIVGLFSYALYYLVSYLMFV